MFILGSTLYVMWFCEFWQMYHAVKFHWPKSPVSYFLLPQLLAAGLIVSVTFSRTSQMWVTASLELARLTWQYRTEVLWGFSMWPHELFLFMQNHKPLCGCTIHLVVKEHLDIPQIWAIMTQTLGCRLFCSTHKCWIHFVKEWSWVFCIPRSRDWKVAVGSHLCRIWCGQCFGLSHVNKYVVLVHLL